MAGRVGATAAGAIAGVAAGFLTERVAVHRRLRHPSGPPLGGLDGEVEVLDGPDGVRLTTESYGPVGGPVVVLAHGWCMTGRFWHEQIAALAQSCRLVTYDQPGHGRSSPPRSGAYSIDLVGDALTAVVAHAARDRPAVVVGHSLGGMAVCNLARRHPDLLGEKVAAAVLVSTTTRTLGTGAYLGLGVRAAAGLERAALAALRAVGGRARLGQRAYRGSSDLSFLLTRSFALAPSADPRHVELTEQLVLDADLDTILALAAPLLTLQEDASLPCLTVPTTVVVGDADWMTPAVLSRRMVERCAAARLVELPGVGHMLPLEAAAELNALILHAVSTSAAGHEAA